MRRPSSRCLGIIRHIFDIHDAVLAFHFFRSVSTHLAPIENFRNWPIRYLKRSFKKVKLTTVGTTMRPADGATPSLPVSLGQFDTNWIRSTVRSIRVESIAIGSIESRQVDEQRSLGVWNRFSDVPQVNDLRCYRFPPRRGSATPEKKRAVKRDYFGVSIDGNERPAAAILTAC